MEIHIIDEQDLLSIDKNSVQAIVKAFLEKEEALADEIAIHFIDDAKISLLHKNYFDDPSPTDCITFPIDPPKSPDDGYCCLGEIFISTETAKRYAEEHGEDPYQETTLYIIHGLLHLLGYDDIEENDRKIMRKKEKSCIHNLEERKLALLPS